MESSPELAAQKILAREVGRDERLLWSGMPKQGLMWRSSDWTAVPFGVVWLAFSVYWEWLVIQAENWVFIAWGIPFLLIGIYQLVGRFFWDGLQRRSTYYGLTERRAIVVSGLRTRQVKSIDYLSLTELAITEHANDEATIAFGSAVAKTEASSVKDASTKAPAMFERIRSGRRVYEMIREQQHVSGSKNT